MKRSTKIYFRSFYISLVVIMCICLAIIGICTAYENIMQTAFGENRSAIEFKDGKLRILDFIVG